MQHGSCIPIRTVINNSTKNLRGILKELKMLICKHAEIEPMYHSETKVPDMMNFKAFPRSVISKHSMPRAAQ